MTVGELIAELEKQPKDAELMIIDCDGDPYEVWMCEHNHPGKVHIG